MEIRGINDCFSDYGIGFCFRTAVMILELALNGAHCTVAPCTKEEA